MENDKIQAMVILEILGKPANHVKESLDLLVSKLGEEKGIKILNKQIHDPIHVKDSKEIFTTFAEVDIEFETIENYFAILFAYMPSNVEIISPERLSLSNIYLNDVGNKIIQRLHNYDAITKKVLFEQQIILEKLKVVAPDVFRQLTRQPTQVSVQPVVQPVKPRNKTTEKIGKNPKKKNKKK